MSKKSKKTPAKTKETKSGKTSSKGINLEKEESVNLKELARDDRTWKITGAVFLLIAVFLCIAFISYFFTWKDDQKWVQGGSVIFDENAKVNNLLGRLGAQVSHFFIYKGFGVASLLICTFFFVVGVNFLFKTKVFSIGRNLKYVTIGLLVLSASLAFIMGSSDFSWGGGVGNMISDWMTGVFGTVGTAAVLLVIALAYFIWQFNPSFNLPEKKSAVTEAATTDETSEPTEPVIDEPSQPIVLVDKNKKDIKPLCSGIYLN